jgi:glycosyltransferase involved in cell wall biosynthesis
MLILLDCRPLQRTGSDSETTRLIISTVAALSGDKDIEWLFVTDHTYRPAKHTWLPDPKAFPRARWMTIRVFPGSLGWKRWYDRRLPTLIRKYNPALVMLTGGVAAKAATARQCLWMPLEADPKAAATPPLYASRLDNSLDQAEAVFCFSEKDRVWLAGRRAVNATVAATETPAQKVIVARPTPSPIATPLEISEKEQLKQHFSAGKEYFFTAAGNARETQIIELLKAFSLFKKRQLSNLQLVIAGTVTGGLREKMKSYKYGQDVHWVGPGDDSPMPAAYAVLFPFTGNSLGASLLDAWKARVPALVAAGSRLHEMAGAAYGIAQDAALVAPSTDPAAWAAHMMSVYKDETLRSALIQRGVARLSVFDPPAALSALRFLIASDETERRYNQ